MRLPTCLVAIVILIQLQQSSLATDECIVFFIRDVKRLPAKHCIQNEDFDKAASQMDWSFRELEKHKPTIVNDFTFAEKWLEQLGARLLQRLKGYHFEAFMFQSTEFYRATARA